MVISINIFLDLKKIHESIKVQSHYIFKIKYFLKYYFHMNIGNKRS